jgi:catechol 2,3-dioxygenase-like lactoylglutathione lyase family enzyme
MSLTVVVTAFTLVALLGAGWLADRLLGKTTEQWARRVANKGTSRVGTLHRTGLGTAPALAGEDPVNPGVVSIPTNTCSNSSPAREVARMSVVRIHLHPDGSDIDASREFYVDALGLEVAMQDPVLCLASPVNPAAQVILEPPGFEDPQPSLGVEPDDPSEVDAAHDDAIRRGLRIVYPITDEPWGVRRFFVEDPGGTIVNVLAHIAA